VNNASLQHIGKISKTHGYNGSLILVSDQDLHDDMENLHEIFIIIDGLAVPFPVEELILRSNTSAQLKLEFVNNPEEASILLGCKACADVKVAEKKTDTEWEKWTGYIAHDRIYGKIGKIKGVEDYNGNVVLQIIRTTGEELLISFFPELITEIDDARKILFIASPEGYFDS
jgi:16S rRNA processing protein RimM